MSVRSLWTGSTPLPLAINPDEAAEGAYDGMLVAIEGELIRAGETPATLAARVRYAEHQLYPRVLADYVLRESDPAWLLGKVRALALALPESHERESHGSPGWRAGSGKSGRWTGAG